MAQTAPTQCQSVAFLPIDGKCDTAIGGVKRVLIAPMDAVIFSAVTTGDTELIQAAIVLKNTGTTFEEYRFRRNTASYSTDVTTDIAKGLVEVKSTVSLQFTKAEAYKRLALQSLINQGAVMIVETMDGQRLYFGDEFELNVSAMNLTSGTATSDMNGITLSLETVGTHLPYFLHSTFDIEELL